MRLQPLYRARFVYPEGWNINLSGEDNTESQLLLFAEGLTEGRISGRFRATNHPRRRTDGTYTPNFQGLIQTDDGAEIYLDYQGYGRTYPPGRRQWVVAATHLSGDPRYKWLNDVVCVGTGEVRARPDATSAPFADLVLDVAEVIWEAIPE